MIINTLNQNFEEGFTPLDKEAEIRKFYFKSSDQTSLGKNNEFFTAFKFVDIDVLLETTNDLTLFQDKERRFIKLTQDFSKEWDGGKIVFEGIEQIYILQMWKKVLDRLLNLNPIFVTFKLSEDISIFYQSEVFSHRVYVELFFDNDFSNKVEAIVNIFKNGKPMLGYGGSIDDTFEKIDTFFSKIKDHYPEPTKINDISNLLASVKGTSDDFGGSTIERAFFNSSNYY